MRVAPRGRDDPGFPNKQKQVSIGLYNSYFPAKYTNFESTAHTVINRPEYSIVKTKAQNKSINLNACEGTGSQTILSGHIFGT